MRLANDFDGRPLIADYVTGRRAWEPDSCGNLHSVVYGHAWTPGVNTAECSYDTDPDLWNWIHTKSNPHTRSGVGCSCGFYAYTRGHSPYDSPSRITGIIRGSGVATCGTKGFRVDRAEIVALVDPYAHRTLRIWTESVAMVLSVAAVIFGFSGFLPVLPFGLLLAMPGLAGWTFSLYRFLIEVYGRSLCNPVSREWIAAVKARYPDVQWFPSMRAARRAFPLSKFPDPHKRSWENILSDEFGVTGE